MTHLSEAQVEIQEVTTTSQQSGTAKLMLAYQAVLLCLALGLLGAAFTRGLGSPIAVVGLAVVAGLAERGRVRLGSAIEVSISVLPTVFAAALFGPLAAMIVATASFVGDFPVEALKGRRRGEIEGELFLKWGIYTCVRAIYGAAAGFSAVAVSGMVQGGVTRLVVATVTAALVAEPLDLAFLALTCRLRGGQAWRLLRMLTPMLVVSISLYTPIVALLTVAYSKVSPWTLALFFLPALAAQRLFGLYQEQRQLTEQVVEANADLEKANLSFATALVTTLDARDRYTAGHSAAVAIYARDIADRMGLPDQEAKKAHLCGLVHDIGKIGLPPACLRSRAR